MSVFLDEILETLPLVGLYVFEIPKAIEPSKDKVSHGEIDTIVVPAHEDGFQEVFLGENAWWAVRISGGMLDKIKYIAAYRTAPISAITHYAEVAKIVPYGNEGKYKIIFANPPVELPRPIPFGDSPKGLMQGPKYTSFSKLKTAKKVADLFKK